MERCRPLGPSRLLGDFSPGPTGTQKVLNAGGIDADLGGAPAAYHFADET